MISPEPGHEHATGRLAIPYMNKSGVIAVKFRCMFHDDCKERGCVKYLCPVGQEVYLYNVVAVDTNGPVVHVTEGELDALVLAEALGEPVVGIPGVSMWLPHWVCHFRGFQRVLVWPDGDKAGRDFVNRLRKEVSVAEFVQMPNEMDVNELYLQVGVDGLRELAGSDDSNVEVSHA